MVIWWLIFKNRKRERERGDNYGSLCVNAKGVRWWEIELFKEEEEEKLQKSSISFAHRWIIG